MQVAPALLNARGAIFFRCEDITDSELLFLCQNINRRKKTFQKNYRSAQALMLRDQRTAHFQFCVLFLNSIVYQSTALDFIPLSIAGVVVERYQWPNISGNIILIRTQAILKRRELVCCALFVNFSLPVPCLCFAYSRFRYMKTLRNWPLGNLISLVCKKF